MFHPSAIPGKALVAIAAGALLAACGGGGSSEPTGRVSVGLTDMPAPDVTEVVVHITGLAFKPEGGAPEVVPDFEARSINLLEYQNGNVAVLLDNVPMNAGRYEWLRLLMDAEPVVDDTYVTLESGHRCELLIPSGAESGLKMNRPIDVPAGGSLALTVDFDVMQSVRMPPGQATDCEVGYKLRPTLRLVNNADAGAISGTVRYESGMVEESCDAPVVYVFEGAVTPDDRNEPATDAEPKMMVKVDIPEGAIEGSYRAAFVPGGDYTLALTCLAANDTPETDDDLEFIFPDDSADGVVTVQNNLIAEADFTVPVPTP